MTKVRLLTNTSCRLIFDLIGDLSSEFRTVACGDIWTTTYSLKKSSISMEYQVMNESNDLDFQIYVCVFGTARQGSWGSMLGFHCVLRIQGLCSCSANFQLALNTVWRVSARIQVFLLAGQVRQVRYSTHSFHRVF